MVSRLRHSYMQDEVELKLQSTPATLQKIVTSQYVKKLKAGKMVSRNLVSTYFDTPRHLLRQAGITLCIRHDGDGYEQTIKAPVTEPTRLRTSREWTGRVPSNIPCVEAIEDRELRAILKRGKRDKRLVPMFTTNVERRIVPLKVGGRKHELALDIGTISAKGGACREPIAGVELELRNGDATAILDLALKLNESLDLTLGRRSKAERGYALARPALRPRACKSSKITLDPQMTVGDAFYRIKDSVLQHLYANEKPVSEGRPEAIHQARVAIRRIRATLRAFKSILPYDKRKAFNGEFRWFQRRLAHARDWHVFTDETLPAIQAAHPDRHEAITRLRKIALAERQRATRDVTDIFESRRYTRLMLQFERWLATPSEVLDHSAIDRPVADFAVAVLEKSQRDFLVDTRPLSRMIGEDLHSLRKRGKKARYASDFFSGLWPESSTRPILKQMENIQDSLGIVNDASVARQLVVLTRPGLLDVQTVWLVQDWSATRIRDCIKQTQRHWRRFQRARHFAGEPAE
jgi:inorganic triphosphatase YgiF